MFMLKALGVILGFHCTLVQSCDTFYDGKSKPATLCGAGGFPTFKRLHDPSKLAFGNALPFIFNTQ